MPFQLHLLQLNKDFPYLVYLTVGSVQLTVQQLVFTHAEPIIAKNLYILKLLQKVFNFFNFSKNCLLIFLMSNKSCRSIAVSETLSFLHISFIYLLFRPLLRGEELYTQLGFFFFCSVNFGRSIYSS